MSVQATQQEITAFANIGAFATLPSNAEPVAPTDLHVGDFVVARGHGKLRLGVVTEVGRKNAKAVYTTPGAIKEAQDRGAYVLALDVEAEVRRAEDLAERNFLYYVQEVDPTTRKHQHDEADLARYMEALRGGLDAYLAKAEADARKSVAERKARAARPVIERVLFTTLQVKPGKAWRLV